MEDGELNKVIGAVARSAREVLGLTQAQVAERAGLTGPVYGRVERGHMMPSTPTLRRIALALDVPPNALLDITPEEMPASSEDLSPAMRQVFALLRSWPEGKRARAVELLQVIEPFELPDDD